MFKYVLFDLDGTLMNFNCAESLAFKTVLDSYAIAYNEYIFNEYIRINNSLWNALTRCETTMYLIQTTRFSELFKKFGYDIDGTEANKIYHESLQNQYQLMPYALEVIRELSKIANLAIVTNGVTNTQKTRISKSAISPYISGIFISEEVGYEKPKIEFFNTVFRFFHNPQLCDIIIVGDSLQSDIQGGINAGICTCYYNPQNNNISEYINPNYIISDLREVVEIVNE